MAEGKLTTQLTEFADRAMCSWMNIPGMQEAVPWLTAGLAQIPTGQTKALAIGMFALQAGCSMINEDVPGEGNVTGEYHRGCNCITRVELFDSDNPPGPSYSGDYVNFEFVRVIHRLFNPDDPDDGRFWIEMEYKGSTWLSGECDETDALHIQNCWQADAGEEGNISWRISMVNPDCSDEAPIVPNPPGPNPTLEPYTGTTIDASCNVRATLIGLIPGSGNSARPVIQMTNEGPARNSGGVIGGCNWAGDLVFVGGDGEDPPTIGPPPPEGPEIPPEDGPMPDWLKDFLIKTAAEIFGDVLEDVFAPTVDETEWYMQAPCQTDPETGEPLEITRVFPKAKLPQATVARLDAFPEFLGQHLAWKTPICHEPVIREGQVITIEFMSDEISPMGDRRLRKRFRYRSKSGRELGSLIDYWKDFVWYSGQACVGHTGAWWGAPQSWASTAAEGKRVIYYAAAEAGIDPDQVGEWKIGGSDNPRYGMSGTMRVRINKGTYCITNRLGPSGLPLVGVVPTDP